MIRILRPDLGLFMLSLILVGEIRADFLAIYIKDPSLAGHILIADGYSAGQTFSGPGTAFDGLVITHTDTSAIDDFIIIDETSIAYGAGGTTWNVEISSVDGFEVDGAKFLSAGLSAGLTTGAFSTLDILVTRQFTSAMSPTDMSFYGGGTESVGLAEADVDFFNRLESSSSATPQTTETLTIGNYLDPLPDAFSFDDALVLGVTQTPNYWLTLGASFQMNGGDSFGGLQFESEVSGFSSVPEPSSILLLGLGGAGFVIRRCWRSRKEKSVTQA